MKNLPERVLAAFEELKKEYSPHLQLKRASGAYIVYEKRSKWSSREGVYKNSLEYIARILEDGLVVPARHRVIKKSDIEGIIERKAIREKVMLSEMENQIEAGQQEVGRYESTILTNLSMNGRMPIKNIAERLGLKTTAAFHQIKKVEAKYGIKYIAELSAEKLGFQTFVALVKFLDDTPSIEVIKQALESILEIQLVTSTSGEYNLFVYFYAESNHSVAQLIHRIRTKTPLKDYQAEWYITPFFDSYGFISIRDIFFNLLKEKVWRRTKEQPRPLLNQITEREYMLLKSLTNDGNANFTDIDTLNNLERGASRYIFERLKEKSIIKRITITLSKSSVKYNAIIFAKIIDGAQFDLSRKNLLLDIIKNRLPHINEYLLVGDMEMPHGVVYIFPVFYENDLQEAIGTLTEKVKGIKLSVLMITSIIIGNLCYRKFDNEYTSQYRILSEEYKIIPKKEKTKYE